jgi:hypothetical protein
MYKLIENNILNSVNFVLRVSDNAFIPFDIENTDYLFYLAWLDAGNTPLPHD